MGQEGSDEKAVCKKVRNIHECSTYGAAKRDDVSGSYGHEFTFKDPPHRGNETPSLSPQYDLLTPSPDPGLLFRVETLCDVITSLIKEYTIHRMKSTGIVGRALTYTSVFRIVDSP